MDISCEKAVRVLGSSEIHNLFRDPGQDPTLGIWESRFHVLYCPFCRESLPRVAQEMDALVELLCPLGGPAEVIKLDCRQVQEWARTDIPLEVNSEGKTSAAIVHLLTCPNPECREAAKSFALGEFSQRERIRGILEI